MLSLSAPSSASNPIAMKNLRLAQTSSVAQESPACDFPHDEVVLGGSTPIDSMQPVPPRDEAYRQQLGVTLWERFQEGKIDLMPVQVSGVNDGADARSNIADTALGRQAKRSSYGNAPGGRVSLSFSLLEGLKTFSDTHTYRVTSLVGGSHSSRSRHYLGVGFDIDMLDGLPVNADHPGFRDFLAKARAMGATEALGPGAAGHDGHIHVAWPRDAVV